MATHSRNTGAPQSFVDAKSSAALLRQRIQTPLDAARQPAMDTAQGLLELMRILPDAFAASQQRELARLLRTSDENSPRVAALKASIEQAETLRTTANLGGARVERALAALTGSQHLFHGFVSDDELTPRQGLTVRVTADRGSASRPLAATTDDAGYFRIDLGPRSGNAADAATPARPVKLSARMEQLMASLERRDGAPSAAAEQPAAGDGQPAAPADGIAGRVEIFDAAGTLLQVDPTPILLDGTAYREYVIATGAPEPGPDRKESASQQASAKHAPAPARDAKTSASSVKRAATPTKAAPAKATSAATERATSKGAGKPPQRRSKSPSRKGKK